LRAPRMMWDLSVRCCSQPIQRTLRRHERLPAFSWMSACVTQGRLSTDGDWNARSGHSRIIFDPQRSLALASAEQRLPGAKGAHLEMPQVHRWQQQRCAGGCFEGTEEPVSEAMPRPFHRSSLCVVQPAWHAQLPGRRRLPRPRPRKYPAVAVSTQERLHQPKSRLRSQDSGVRFPHFRLRRIS